MTALHDSATAEEWLEYARRDLGKASAMHRSGAFDSCDVCASAQQSAEKSLKAVLLHRGKGVPHMHDLRELRSRCSASIAPHITDERLDALSALWVSSRYPGDWPEPTQADANDAVEVARAIAADVTRIIAEKENG